MVDIRIWEQWSYHRVITSICSLVPAVPRKLFGSADCDNLYTFYLSLCTQLIRAIFEERPVAEVHFTFIYYYDCPLICPRVLERHRLSSLTYMYSLISESSHELFGMLYTLSIYPSVHPQLIRTLRTLFEAYSVHNFLGAWNWLQAQRTEHPHPGGGDWRRRQCRPAQLWSCCAAPGYSRGTF